MQWIFMLAGLLLGAASDESLSGAIFGGLIGLALGQALKVHALEFQQSALRKELQAFAERFEQGTAAIHQRLLKVETWITSPSRARKGCACGPRACIASSVMACEISVPRIFSIDTSAPGGWPLRRILSRKRMDVSSSAADGTRFTVRLPRSVPAVPVPRSGN